MHPQPIAIAFAGPSEPSLEAAIHRWIVRLELLGCTIDGGDVRVEHGKRTTKVWIGVAVGAHCCAVERSHADPYVAVADAFRAVLQTSRTGDCIPSVS
ncbi:MAG: hypothetical protein NT062_21975 [Proteobacteria bacterium]|nr:hypothetical protein [Pseudomonadota bacterium]